MKFHFLLILTILLLLDDYKTRSVLSQDPEIAKYKIPTDCLGFYTTDNSGVALTCDIPAVNHKLYNASFEAVQTKFTKSLGVTCTSAQYAESSFEETSLSHLTELQEVVFNKCKFSSLTSGTFTNLRNLRYLTVRCEHDQSHTLFIQNSVFSPLQSLQVLDLQANNLKTFPKDELCHLDNLQQVVLNDNNLTDVGDLGFSGPCENDVKPCCPSLYDIHLTSNHFSSLPRQSFCRLPHLQLLNLHGNGLKLVEEGTFYNLNSLGLLDLSYNNLTGILPNLWQGLSQLLVLNISHNYLSGMIDETTFQHLGHLNVLDLSFNQVEVVDSATFKDLNNLNHLSLSSNKIRRIQDETFSNLSDLVLLFLDHNDISTVGETNFSGLKKLLLFWINDNNMSSIADNTFACCPLLLNVSLANNFLSKLPNLNILPDLITLDLSHNALEHLPENTFSNLKNLTEVSLRHNNLREISEKHFANLTKLFLLNLSENRITTIHPNSFKTNLNLAFLQLKNNNLDTLMNLQTNFQLLYLNLSNNDLQYLDYGLLPSSLKILAADRNRIASLETRFYTAKGIPITHLDLSHNKITTIKTTSLPPTLQVVNLESNNISYIEGYSFNSMKSLQTVFLQVNVLSSFYKTVFKTDTAFRRPAFYLSGNNLHCTCNMLWMQSINTAPNNDYGMIYDLEYLYCWLPHIRNTGPLKLITETEPKNFMCAFENHTFSDLLCPTDKRRCIAFCPESCSCFRDLSWNYVTTDCKGSNMTSVPGNIAYHTSVLYLDGTFITTVTQESFDQGLRLTELYLNKTGLEILGDNSFAKLNNLSILHLEFNRIQELPSNSFTGLENLRELYLFSNALRQLHEHLFKPLKSITTLQIQNNLLVDFPVWTFQEMPSLRSLTLSQNPWTCDCDYIEKYRNWLQNYSGKITDVEQLMCYPENNDTVSIPLIEFNTTYCLKGVPMTSGQYLVIILTVTIFLTITLVCILLFIHRHEMQVLIYSRYGVRIFHGQKEVDDERKIYDAFISYSNEDEEFVVRKLIPKLENLEFPYKLCLHQRDFAAGAFISESIMEAVEYSRRTILVMTEHFIQSEWCRFEFKTAHLQMMKDKCNRVIMIVLGDIPKDLDSEMKLYLKTNTYLQWEDRLFWQKLYFSLPEKRSQN